MPITWKTNKRFKPKVVLDRLSKSREVKEDGVVSFSDFQIHQDTAALSSMINFPDVASDMNHESLIWRALALEKRDLTPENFIAAINKELSARLAKKEEKYVLAAEISFESAGWPKRMAFLGAVIEFHGYYFPKKFSSRSQLISRHGSSVDAKGDHSKYCHVTVGVSAKSADAAATKAIRAIDIFRAILCIEGNKTLEVTLAGTTYKPINLVRLGCFQSLHRQDGTAALDTLWYEPSFLAAKTHKFKKVDVVSKNVRFALQRMKRSAFGKEIAESLVRFARALDDADPNTAFIRLWGAFEMLLTPGRADYDALIDRCCFILQEPEYHRQVLAHLREYRNASVHTGYQTDQARTNCFLLQRYYRYLFWFLIQNALRYRSLSELHDFLSLPQDVARLKASRKIINEAISFLTP